MKLLLFDLDGTLLRAYGAGRKALNRAVANVYGVRVDCGKLGLAGKTDLHNFAEAIRAATGSVPKRRGIERVHREYLRLLPHYVRVTLRAKKYSLSPGIKRLLNRLRKEKDILLALGTGNMEKGARIKLGPSGLNEYFLFGGYGSDALHRPAILKKAYLRAARFANGAKIRPRDVFVIGDTPLDVSAGKKAGFKTIAVGTGFSAWRELVESKPDYLARDFRNVDRWLGWFGIRKTKRRRSR